jgi:hypothetical protein
VFSLSYSCRIAPLRIFWPTFPGVNLSVRFQLVQLLALGESTESWLNFKFLPYSRFYDLKHSDRAAFYSALSFIQFILVFSIDLGRKGY